MSRPLREVAEVHYGKSPAEVVSVDGTIPIIGTGGIYGRATRHLFSGPGVVVPRKGSLGNPQYIEGAFWPVDTTYALLPKTGISARWIYYSLALFDLTRLNEATGVPSISRDWLYKIPLGDANSNQQLGIAEILSTVDDAIAQTEALIAKTQQIKAGLLHDLFTRGLQPDGTLRPRREDAPELYKESPLGWIPRDWRIESLGSISTYVTSGSRGWATYYSDEGPLFIRIGNLTREHINLRMQDVQHVRLPNGAEGSRTCLSPGDVLISITADLGIIGVMPDGLGDAYINQHIALVRIAQTKASSRWIGHFLASDAAQRRIRRLDDPGAKAGLNLPTVRSLLVAIPKQDGDEQARAVEQLDSLDRQIAREGAHADKLRSLKHGLMQDLLTGRVRVPVGAVREAVADV